MDTNDNLYNADRKLSFIDHYSKFGKTESANAYRRKFCLNIFGRLAPVEKRHNKDFCEFARKDSGMDEFDELYIGWLNTLSTQRAANITSILRAYIKWCYENNYISFREYVAHEFASTYGRVPRRTDSPAPIIARQLQAAKKGEARQSKDFVFENEGAFINYVRALFKDDRYIMIATLVILLYYQFDFETARGILKSEVDIKNRKVRDTVIDNSDAFSIICDAANATEYKTFVEYNSDVSFERIETYVDSPYLLRNAARGASDPDPDGKISPYFMSKLVRREKEAAECLPKDSPYNGILIKSYTISKLKVLFEIKKDEDEYGQAYVKNKLEAGEYDTPWDYRSYRLMCARMKPIA